MWVMAGVGLARVIGFVLDGPPDTRQLIWIGAEVVIVIACVFGLRAIATAAARRRSAARTAA